jgi:hypothetical protein
MSRDRGLLSDREVVEYIRGNSFERALEKIGSEEIESPELRRLWKRVQLAQDAALEYLFEVRRK